MPDETSTKTPNWGPRLTVAAILGILGFAMTVQFNQVETEAYAVRGAELVELLKSLDAANERVDDEIDELRVQRDQLESSNKLSEEAGKQAAERAKDLAILAGSTAVEGPGIVLTVEDPSALVDAALLLDIVQELRDGGAEAVVINGAARVVAQTYFTDDSGGAIRVGGREVSPPYVIEVIGDPKTLEEAVEFRGGILDRLQGRGAEGSVDRRDRILISALADIKTPEYAQGED